VAGPLAQLAPELAGHPQRLLIERCLATVLAIGRLPAGSHDWQLLDGALRDLEDALAAFHPHRLTRKVSVFGSARSAPGSAAYRLAEELGAAAVAAGFEVITGAGGGVMEAANRGAGGERSFGLNIELPFEQEPNLFVADAPGRLIHFRYFFTRKLFFLRESDALVVLPGGFGTLDELFEALTLIQTGRTPPIPLVLLAPADDDYWRNWHRQLRHGLAERGLIAPEDVHLLREAGSVAEAIALIQRFYRVFHTTRVSGDRLELLLHAPLPEVDLHDLNDRFADLLRSGRIEASESCDDTDRLRPALQLDFDRRRVGRLYQLIDHLNQLPLPVCAELQHPEQRLCPPDLPTPAA
jgi:uncharacterized protein (TIGR00730 family)